MSEVGRRIDEETARLAGSVLRQQRDDGSFRFCFENGTGIDAYMIILMRTLKLGSEELIRRLHDRIAAAQQPDGGWRLYADEEGGNLSASVEAYYAMLCSGFSKPSDEALARAKRYIMSKGGLKGARSILTRAILAATGQSSWPLSVCSIPLEVVLLPVFSPIHIFDFSGYSRVHLIPMLIMAHRRFSVRLPDAPDLKDLLGEKDGDRDDQEQIPPQHLALLHAIHSGLSIPGVDGSSRTVSRMAEKRAEQFLLERLERDGTLYSYASSTILLVFSLLALGYDREHPVIIRAMEGLAAMRCQAADGTTTIQNSPSTVWDTALLAYILEEAGIPDGPAAVGKAVPYLLARQHQQAADWSVHNPGTPAGGWGFSESNTLNPDVDDTTAALRAISSRSRTDPACREASDRGLNWLLSMQNTDGGWPSFEKNTDKTMLTWLAIEGAKAAATDPSEADLTGRTLEYLGNFCGFDTRHEFIRRGCKWLFRKQEADGSWYGRWGVCYIYGTWAALTGLRAAGISACHEAVHNGMQWLLRAQNTDGGWGESCSSDQLQRYVPLGESTPSQTAWALDALIAIEPRPTAAIDRGIRRLTAFTQEEHAPASCYPTGAGLPGYFYSHYHSYRFIWPLLALSHYKKKYS
ncbi:MAG: squalene-hopene cyclase [Paenibacillaceae bacterium]|nr:squalene-hopene cyclase [Paenibacillaceae bacterium]